MRGKRIWRAVALVLAIPALLAWTYGAGLESSYQRLLPQVANPMIGRVFPRNIHGIVVFQTHAEKLRLDLIEGISISAFFAGLTIGGLEERHWRRSAGTNLPLKTKDWSPK